MPDPLRLDELTPGDVVYTVPDFARGDAVTPAIDTSWAVIADQGGALWLVPRCDAYVTVITTPAGETCHVIAPHAAATMRVYRTQRDAVLAAIEDELRYLRKQQELVARLEALLAGLPPAGG
jgi:hypothetical protein